MDPVHTVELNRLITKVSLVLIIYAVLAIAFPKTSFPGYTALFLIMSVVSRSSFLARFKNNILSRAEVPVVASDKQALCSALYNVSQYQAAAKTWNDNKRSMFRSMSWRQQALVTDIGYPARLKKIDACIGQNAVLLKDLYAQALAKHGLCARDVKAANGKSEYYRVVESLCHYARDWSSAGDVEVGPLIEYVRSQVAGLDKGSTMVVVPGSGLGRVSHELALEKFHSVHSVEFSALMYLFNEFVYSGTPKTYRIHPYLHNFSNHTSLANQIRQVDFTTLSRKPENLHIHNKDFTRVSSLSSLGDTEGVKTLVVVTAFFMDTAENMLDYIDTINDLADDIPRGGRTIWINAGPLKYGTAAKVELNNEEFGKLRQKMGWTPVHEQKPRLLGYLTDLESLWQGNYGVTMWSCEKKRRQ